MCASSSVCAQHVNYYVAQPWEASSQRNSRDKATPTRLRRKQLTQAARSQRRLQIKARYISNLRVSNHRNHDIVMNETRMMAHLRDAIILDA